MLEKNGVADICSADVTSKFPKQTLGQARTQDYVADLS